MTASLSSPVDEKFVVGAEIDLGAQAVAIVIGSGVTPEIFTDPFARRAHECVLRLHASGLPINPGKIWESMKLEPTENIRFVELTADIYHSTIELSRVCAELLLMANRRKISGLAKRLDEAAQNNPDEVDDVIARLLVASAPSQTQRDWVRVCDDAVERAKSSIEGRVNTDDWLSWGWVQLDAHFKQMRRGELVIIAARPSVGKSSLLRGISAKAAFAGRHVLFETLEVSQDDVADQMATAVSGIACGELAKVHPGDQTDFLAAVGQLRAAPLHVFEDRSLAGIIARVKAVHATRPVDLLAVDYLGKITDCEPGKGQTKAQAIGRVTGALKALALELRIVVLCAAQLNRNAAIDDNREPRLSDLRDSGDIEQDADRVVIIHRPDECPLTRSMQSALDSIESRPRYGCALIQAKGRNVGTGYGAVWFNRQLARFECGT